MIIYNCVIEYKNLQKINISPHKYSQQQDFKPSHVCSHNFIFFILIFIYFLFFRKFVTILIRNFAYTLRHNIQPMNKHMRNIYITIKYSFFIIIIFSMLNFHITRIFFFKNIAHELNKYFIHLTYIYKTM